MRISFWTPVVTGVTAILLSSTAWADSYTSLVHRYEKQIQQQEKQLKTLRARLDGKERDVSRWRAKADEAKASWSDVSETLEQTRAKAKSLREKRKQVRLEADAAQWKTTENILLSRSAVIQARVLAQDLYGKSLVLKSPEGKSIEEASVEVVFAQMAELSAYSHLSAEKAQQEESALRTEEMSWQNEEQATSEEAGRLHQKQSSQWFKWQEAQQRKTALEDEISQIEQSAKALQVMLQELRDHRNQARAWSENRSVNDNALALLKGSLPWPAQGKVVQNFGRHYSDGLKQLVVSNGIKISAGTSHGVRSIQGGKVLFANAFRHYGQLVIVQHKNGLTSVYAGLGHTEVNEGQALRALDPIGSTGDSGSFYFELRRDERPVNPLVYLSPAPTSELSSRRKYR